MYQLPAAPLSLGGILDDGFKLFKASWKQLLPIALVASLLASVPQILVSGLDTLTPEGMGALATLGVGFVVLTILIVLLSMISYAVLIAGVHQAARSEPVTLGSAFREGLRRAPSFLGLVLIVMLAAAILGIAAALVMPVVSNAARAVLIAAVLVLLIFLSVALYPAGLLPIVEELGPTASLARAWQLVKGSWWRTAIILTVVGLILIALVFVISFVAGLAAIPSAFVGNSKSAAIAVQLFVAVLTAPLLPLMYCLFYAVYTDLRLRRDGGDLLSRAAAVGA